MECSSFLELQQSKLCHDFHSFHNGDGRRATTAAIIHPISQPNHRSPTAFIMTDICRLCASLKRLDHLITIADPSLSVKTKLLRCCQVELPANDDFMPQNICTDCISNLNNSWVFAEKVHQAQETLKQAFMSDFDQQMIETQKPVENGGTVQVAMVRKPYYALRNDYFCIKKFPAYKTKGTVIQDTQYDCFFTFKRIFNQGYLPETSPRGIIAHSSRELAKFVIRFVFASRNTSYQIGSSHIRRVSVVHSRNNQNQN